MAINEPRQFPFRYRNQKAENRSTLYAILAAVALVGLALIAWSTSDNAPVNSDLSRVEAPATNPNR